MKPTSLHLLAAFVLGIASCGWAAEPARPARAPRAVDPAFAPVTDQAGLPRVLLIGDSISIGYTKPVRDLLKGKATVHRIPTNGGPTTRGLESLSQWLGTSTWDVIHFNWGLHDLKFVGPTGDARVAVGSPGSRPQVELPDYEANLGRLVTQLKASGAKLIWCTTTPVPQGALVRTPGDEDRYNEAAARVMKAGGVPINDLCAHARARLAEIQLPANVHFTAAGSTYLSEKVAAAIERALPAPPANPARPAP